MKGLRERILRRYLETIKANEGQGFVEYLMIIGLVALGLALALIAFQNQLSNALSVVGAGV